MGYLTPWLLGALVLFWAVGAYNRLIRLRAVVLQAFQPVDARLVQCIALLQEQAPLAFDPQRTQPLLVLATTNLWSSLQAACTQFDVALRVVRRQVFDAEAMAALHTAHTTLQDWWERLTTECSTQSDMLPPQWQAAWNDNQRQARDLIAVFNQAVRAHNAAVTQFPALVLARTFGFQPAGCL